MKHLAFLLISILFTNYLISQEIEVDFESDSWNIVNGKVVDHDGKKCFMGTGYLKNFNFTNGIIEYDLAIDGRRSYPGVNFRIQSPYEYESFYIRPHRMGLYPDALQYTPAFKGDRTWQFYNGEGYTAAADKPVGEWVHVKLIVNGNQAQLFLNNNETPALLINDLKHGLSSGSIALNSPANGTAYFTKLTIDTITIPELPAKRKEAKPYGMITNWEVSHSMKLNNIDVEKTPIEQGLEITEWKEVKADPSGLVNISDVYPRSAGGADCIYAKTIIKSDREQIIKYNFGYSDAITIFLNGNPVFFGLSPYQGRDPSFLGILGLNDAVFLPLKEGDNELMIMLGEAFGGWGFMFQDASSIYEDVRLNKVWETNTDFQVPESVLYDKKRNLLYISNFDQLRRTTTGAVQSISAISINGEVIDLNYIDSLDNPLGMKIFKDKLYVAEKANLAIVDLESRKIIERIPLEKAGLLNDVEVDDNGNIYISDSRGNGVYKITDGVAELWLEEGIVMDPNTLRIADNKLYVGNSGDQTLKSFDLKTKGMEVIANFEPGFIDGIRILKDGSLLVSLWSGKLYHISKDGAMGKLLDLENKGIYIADFEYIEDLEMLYIPTFYENKIIGYNLKLD
ncbi:SMP-30/gluconolactonase/LRE family protein [Bacteroidota bacterium]